jgi:hypothetical protein
VCLPGSIQAIRSIKLYPIAMAAGMTRGGGAPPYPLGVVGVPVGVVWCGVVVVASLRPVVVCAQARVLCLSLRAFVRSVSSC